MDQYHPTVLVTWVHQKDKHAVDGVSVGVSVENGNRSALLALQVVEGGLESGREYTWLGGNVVALVFAAVEVVDGSVVADRFQDEKSQQKDNRPPLRFGHR